MITRRRLLIAALIVGILVPLVIGAVLYRAHLVTVPNLEAMGIVVVFFLIVAVGFAITEDASRRQFRAHVQLAAVWFLALGADLIIGTLDPKSSSKPFEIAACLLGSAVVVVVGTWIASTSTERVGGVVLGLSLGGLLWSSWAVGTVSDNGLEGFFKEHLYDYFGASTLVSATWFLVTRTSTGTRTPVARVVSLGCACAVAGGTAVFASEGLGSDMYGAAFVSAIVGGTLGLLVAPEDWTAAFKSG